MYRWMYNGDWYTSRSTKRNGYRDILTITNDYISNIQMDGISIFEYIKYIPK